MYHYIREGSKRKPYSAHKEMKDFVSEISKWKRNQYTFRSVCDLQKCNKWRNVEKARTIVLTFDDGFVDHYHAARELYKLGITAGTFFVSTKPYVEQVVLPVHKAHYIRSIYGPDSLDLLLKAAEKTNSKLRILPNKKNQSSQRKIYSHQNDDDKTKEFKRIVNYYGNSRTIDVVLEEILHECQVKLKSTETYMTPSMIREISDMGFEVASHAHSHRLLSDLSNKEQREELTISRKILEDIIEKPVTSFAYPYGRPNSYNMTTVALLKQLGYTSAVCVEGRDIRESDIFETPFTLPRYDCNTIKNLYSELK